MKLEELTPPLNLCKLIPDGEFEDSAMVWMESAVHGMKVFIRSKVVQDVLAEKFPAPTTDEILDKCKDIIGVLNPTLWYQHEWIADCAYDRTGKLSEEFFEDDDFDNMDIIEGRDKDPVIAAMKLWLKLKGIEYAE